MEYLLGVPQLAPGPSVWKGFPVVRFASEETDSKSFSKSEWRAIGLFLFCVSIHHKLQFKKYFWKENDSTR